MFTVRTQDLIRKVRSHSVEDKIPFWKLRIPVIRNKTRNASLLRSRFASRQRSPWNSLSATAHDRAGVPPDRATAPPLARWVPSNPVWAARPGRSLSPSDGYKSLVPSGLWPTSPWASLRPTPAWHTHPVMRDSRGSGGHFCTVPLSCKQGQQTHADQWAKGWHSAFLLLYRALCYQKRIKTMF